MSPSANVPNGGTLRDHNWKNPDPSHTSALFTAAYVGHIFEINRMAKKGADVGLQVGWQSDKTDPLTREKLYGVRDFGSGEHDYDRIQMSGVEYARLLSDARAAAEQ